MVKLFFSFLLLVALVNAGEIAGDKEDLLTQKIKQLVDTRVYNKNRGYIKTIFSKKSRYYKQGQVNVMPVLETLKANGLLKLDFDEPQKLTLSFKTEGHPVFFIKIISDTLRNIGYYRYVTTESSFDNEEFSWTVELRTEQATDPTLLHKELKKSKCKVVDANRVSLNEWEYTIDTSRASLDVPKVKSDEEMQLKRSLYAHWLNVSSVKKLQIISGKRNNWYPYIVYYDNSLHILKVIKEDTKTKEMIFKIPKDAKYMKISDIYTMKNLKDNLELNPIGER